VLQRKVSETGVVYYQSPLLARVGVPHGFSTRLGGVSMSPFDSLNLGNPQGAAQQDEWERINENYRRLIHAIGASNRERAWVHQVHGGDVVFVRREHEFSNGARADALVSDDPDRLLTIRVADCVPILLASDDGAAVAAVHAGWRGVIAGAVPNAVRELKRFTDRPLLAAIGPCISRGSFEVGPEVMAQFDEHFAGENGLVDRNGDVKGHVDLRRAVQIQLQRAGLSADQIDSNECCTYRDAEEFFSHRREKGLTGRLAALIAARRI
jgi:YfiH family protein